MLKVLTTRAINLNLLRHFYGSNEATANALTPAVSSASLLSQMAIGEREVKDHEARKIEEKLALPNGWLDRNNRALCKMSDLQFQINTCLVNLTVEKQSALLTLLSQDPN